MIVDLFNEEIGTFDLPGLQRVDGCSMPQRALWDVLIVQVDVSAQGRLQIL